MLLDLSKIELIREPFNHFVIDNFYDVGQLEKIIEKLPYERHVDWKKSGNGKHALYRVANHIPEAALYYFRIHSDKFCQQLSEIFGIPNIVPDRMNNGAGFHKILPGGRLGIHVDFNHLKKGDLYRRLNCFLYLNDHWEDYWGGHLELWESKEGLGTTGKVYRPAFNRFICFECSESSWHGHPTSLNCPPDRARMSLASYYYTEEKPEWFREVHSTLYVE